ncbi:hypothetical protein, conserved in T. vivax [Trypanosoma vivax Y486]|uniref:Trypanosoma glutamic acid/alanine-rich protein domain-containing protein n=1 Tax=Trypanosoma vivax (strain Y486) TaxID=1055687 RepID=F9WRH1_TRYVY|nr:hypothetical protein, conserved in T. vivax [Trypanosoma vivax Y486]|eukprot:CCD20155.1 hypothetical protein, conserved in T. vivax [Trypanosoma vivax Y486]
MTFYALAAVVLLCACGTGARGAATDGAPMAKGTATVICSLVTALRKEAAEAARIEAEMAVLPAAIEAMSETQKKALAQLVADAVGHATRAMPAEGRRDKHNATEAAAVLIAELDSMLGKRQKAVTHARTLEARARIMAARVEDVVNLFAAYKSSATDAKACIKATNRQATVDAIMKEVGCRKDAGSLGQYAAGSLGQYAAEELADALREAKAMDADTAFATSSDSDECPLTQSKTSDDTHGPLIGGHAVELAGLWDLTKAASNQQKPKISWKAGTVSGENSHIQDILDKKEARTAAANEANKICSMGAFAAKICVSSKATDALTSIELAAKTLSAHAHAQLARGQPAEGSTVPAADAQDAPSDNRENAAAEPVMEKQRTRDSAAPGGATGGSARKDGDTKTPWHAAPLTALALWSRTANSNSRPAAARR